MKIKLDSIEDVKLFTHIVDHMNGRFTLESGRYMVDASSILGVLSLDLTRPLILHAEYCEEELVKTLLRDYIVEE